ncbi:hypothetical protein QQ045_009306 [Rhodiola kirilowii]
MWLFSNINLLSDRRIAGALGDDVCDGRRIHVVELPPKFNYGLLDNCGTISKKKNMCVYIENHGFGPKIFNESTAEDSDGGFEAWSSSSSSWYDTDQFTLELIFHTRMKRYDCLTSNSSLADAIYIPFYAGLEASRTLRLRNTAERDRVGKEVMKYISSLSGWRVWEGRDHFFVAGRIGRDFIRPVNSSYWGNSLMCQTESKHITMLTLEASGRGSHNEVAIPYPTYFHPSSFDEVRELQRYVVVRPRKHLFAFAGAPRRRGSFRDEVISQCKASKNQCGLISCGNGDDNKECQSPLKVIKLFQNSKFCLQPPGDSPTRRSTFDSIISGCIPVFFSLNSGPDQYHWHFPMKYTEYSVYINQESVRIKKVEIAKVLSSIAEETVEAMRSKVVEMIPRVIYKNLGRGELDEYEDAFDIAVQGILKRVDENKRNVSS